MGGRADGYRLAVEPDAVDAVRFERLVSQANAVSQANTVNPACHGEDARRVKLLREALGLWRGAPFQDIGLADSAAFDASVARFDGLRLTAWEDCFEAEIRLGGGADLVAELTDLTAAHPVRERLAAALIRALAAAGRTTDAVLAYQRTKEALADSLGVAPSPELSALHVALLRGELGQREQSRETNLRAELTSFVGRDADVAAVGELIADHRLTTLLGPGGAGKTRLATETARTLLGDLPDGAWLVELAAISAGGDRVRVDGDRVDGEVARAAHTGLGLRDSLLDGPSQADLTYRIIAAIRDREMLLILDNCEHVIASAAAFAHRLLGECPRLRILATSREPLGITGEALWPLEPLALPAADASTGEIESSPAVRLLRDRADAVRRNLVADADTLRTMVDICRALDGMPLAIELAAASLRTLSIDQLASRLDDRFRLLTNGSRTALPRQRTLRAVVDWSWELLSDAERLVLRRLSVFSGGASLEAAERVCASYTNEENTHEENTVQENTVEENTVESARVLELLTALTEKSLLVSEGGGAPRYRMIGTIKEYAGARLAEAGETDLARRAHLAYFTEFAEFAEPRLRRAEQLEWLAALDIEHDNIGAAMRGALAAGEAYGAWRLAAAAAWYWWLGGHKAEGNELIMAATETPGEVPDGIRATVYAVIVQFLNSGRGDERQSAEWIRLAYTFDQLNHDDRHRHPLMGFIIPLERMLAEPDTFLPAFEPLLDDEDPWARALARLHLGKMRIVLGQDAHEAEAYLEKALAEFRAIGERFGISFALTELADRLATRGEFARACEHYEQAIGAITEVGALEDVVHMRARQAELYWLLGDTDSSAAAIADAQRCVARVSWPNALAALALTKAGLARWGGDYEQAYEQIGVATTALGDGANDADIRAIVHNLLGYLADDLDEARAEHAKAWQAACEAGFGPLNAAVLAGVTDLALRREQYEQAARLLAATADVRGLPNHFYPDEARIERALRQHLGDARFAEAAKERTRTDWRQLVSVALAP